MIIGKDNILAWFEKHGKKYYAIYKRGEESKGTPIDNNTKGEEEEVKNVDHASAYSDFTKTLQWLSTGDYVLMVSDRPKVGERGGNREEFRITTSDSMANNAKDIVQVGSIGAPGYSVDEMLAKAKAMAADEFERLMAKKDAEDMRAKNAELEKELKDVKSRIDDPINKFIGALAPHAEPIIAGILGPSAPLRPLAVAGVNHLSVAKPDRHLDDNATVEEVDLHAQKVFEDFTLSLQAARPDDWLEILVKLTTIIKENPKKFETALSFL